MKRTIEQQLQDIEHMLIRNIEERKELEVQREKLLRAKQLHDLNLDDPYGRLIDDLHLSNRITNSLWRASLRTIGDVIDLLHRDQAIYFWAIRGLGQEGRIAVLCSLDRLGYLPLIRPEIRNILRRELFRDEARQWQIPAGL